jgi:hypothetical protein
MMGARDLFLGYGGVPGFISDFEFGCMYKYSMHIWKAFGIKLIVMMEMFIDRSVQNLHLAVYALCLFCLT